MPWQASQCCVVGMWVRGMPMARTELWQVAQVCGGDRAVIKARRRPGVGGVAALAGGCVGRCFAGLPVAVTPLWQLTQLPRTCV